MLKVLLLNDNYESLSFIDDKRGFKLLVKEKVDLISSWDEGFKLLSGKFINYPSVLRLKNHVKKVILQSDFSRVAIMKRDKNCCQYCGAQLQGAQITIDHVLPKSKGGKSNFTNCVIACQPCNNKKGSMTLSEAKMKLLNQPINPRFNQSLRGQVLREEFQEELWHEDWNSYLT